MIADLQTKTGSDALRLSGVLGVGYRRLLRWRKRASAGQPALASPGPRKTSPLPLSELKAEIAALCHGSKRTRGTLALYAQHRHAISRRDLAQLVAAERTRQKELRRQSHKRIVWLKPNVAWAIDATERSRDQNGQKLLIHAVQDLCSHYGFAPLIALESKGEAIAQYLEKLFLDRAPPLFLKRDNGSPFNHEAVDAVLAKYGVIPLNSPARYPQYNGAIENGIGHIQAALDQCLPAPACWEPAAVTPYLIAVQHELNCRPRRSLRGDSAAEAYYHQPHVCFGKRARLETFEWIKIHAIDRINQLEKIDQRSVLAAWRAAAETWLRCQGLITVSINNKVLPNLPRNYVRN